MRSLFEKKPWVLLLAILALGALTILSVSLRSVSFNEAQPVGWNDPPSSSTAGGEGANGQLFKGVSWELQIGLLVSILVLAGLVSLLISPEARKRFLRLLFQGAVTFWVLSYVLKKYPDMLTLFNPNALNEIVPSDAVGEEIIVPPAVFTPPPQTPFLSYAISVILILIMGLSMWRLYFVWKKMNTATGSTLSDIARIARRSLKDLSTDGDSTDVILNCYFRMSDVVSDKKNIHRDIAMTPSEFAHRMERSGLPGDAVRRLTRLFESVRYGSNKAGPNETNEAVSCLTTILHYCGETV